MSPLICYQDKKFGPTARAMIKQANAIIADYRAQGYRLTLRQLYYQFVARDLIRNEVREYKRLGGIVNDGRVAGLIDWDAIEDRTRNLESLAHWNDPSDIIETTSKQFRVDRWDNQPYRVEVWIEKEALAGVFERVCNELDVPFLCCRGYTSQSEMWGAAQRLIGYEDAGQKCLILHFGDHDPSGIDMTRDIQDRLRLFEADVEVRRMALNMDQVDQWNPPPNPAKATDSRFEKYLETHGGESWELDALDPATLSALVRDEIMSGEFLDEDAWEQSGVAIKEGRELLKQCAGRWNEVKDLLDV